MFWVLVRNKWTELRNFPLLISFFFFLGCYIRTAYSEIISEFAGRTPPECQKNPDDIWVKKWKPGFRKQLLMLWDGFAARPYILQSDIGYLESCLLSLQTELHIPQADTEVGGCGWTLSCVYKGCLWVGDGPCVFRRLCGWLGAAGREKGWKLAKSSAIWMSLIRSRVNGDPSEPILKFSPIVICPEDE